MLFVQLLVQLLYNLSIKSCMNCYIISLFFFYCVDFIDWNNAHHGENYLDMVKVKYRTFQIEYPNTEVLTLHVLFVLLMYLNECLFYLYVWIRVMASYLPCSQKSLVLSYISTTNWSIVIAMNLRSLLRSVLMAFILVTDGRISVPVLLILWVRVGGHP
jgi:hypothetical protein